MLSFFLVASILVLSIILRPLRYRFCFRNLMHYLQSRNQETPISLHVFIMFLDQTCNHICPKNTLFLNHPWRQTMPLPGPQAAKRTSPPSTPPLHPPQKLLIENVFNLRLYSCLRVIKAKSIIDLLLTFFFLGKPNAYIYRLFYSSQSKSKSLR